MAATPSSGSTTSPVPERMSVRSLSATIRSASRRRRKRSVRQSFASSTAARARFLLKSFNFPSNRSKRVNASAVAPAKPARIEPSPRRPSFFAPCFITVLSSVTCPSAPRATLPSLRTHTTVVERIRIVRMLTLRAGTCDATLLDDVRLRRQHPLRRHEQRAARLRRIRAERLQRARRDGGLVPRSVGRDAPRRPRGVGGFPAAFRARLPARGRRGAPVGGGGVRAALHPGGLPRPAPRRGRGRHP